MTTPAIDIHHLFFNYEDIPILEDVTFSIQQGDFVAIFGPNGGGKTTLLKLMLGLLAPNKGKVLIFGQDPVESRGLIGYVPQVMRVDREFPISVLEVVMTGCLSKLNWLGRFPKEIKRKAEKALERVNLFHKATTPFGTLSGGEAQRALIARAIVDSPQLLLLDEPTASVDPEAEQNIYQLLQELNQAMTILMVTHDLQTIIDKVGNLLCVHRQVNLLKPHALCEHFALGLYHTPLTSKDHFSL
jgi:zinc transport system ATP-binding protein